MKSETTFAFDRLTLDFNVDLGKNNGFKNELQTRSLKTSVNNDIRFESIYYQKNVFLQGDELDFGIFGLNTFMPFKNGYSNVMAIPGGLGGALGMSQVVGAMYSLNKPHFDFALGVANSRSAGENWDLAGEGLNTTMRVNYKPITGLKIGAGYEIIANKDSNPPNLYNSNLNRSNRMVVDASYNGTPLGGIIEYITDTSVVSGATNDSISAMYGELGYKIGTCQLYAGRAVNTAGALLGKIPPTFVNAGSVTNFRINNNYFVVGALYPLPSGPILGLEYVKVDTGANSLGLRCRVNF